MVNNPAMRKKSLKHTERKKFLGKFAVAEGAQVVGELVVSGRKTLLTVHADARLQEFEEATTVHGMAFTGEHLSLLNCVTAGSRTNYSSNAVARHHAHVFPHHVVTGNAPLRPDDCCIEALEFQTGDMRALFHDFDTYGTVLDAEPFMEKILEKRRRDRDVQTGDHPILAYYTGKREIVEVQTAIGLVTVLNRSSHTSGGTKGVHLKNRIAVRVTPAEPLNFAEAMRRTSDMLLFLSVIAGRVQDVRGLRITTTQFISDLPVVLAVHPSQAWRKRRTSDSHEPHCRDIPLDPIGQPEEFRKVLSNWMDGHEERRVARFRHLAGMRKASRYGPDRIVAAANLFDIFPSGPVSDATGLPPEVTSAVNQCREILRKLPQSGDRDGALSALGRLGKPSLPKKVASRAKLVMRHLPELSELDWVGHIGVKCRNVFVHGPSGDFEFSKVDGFLPFLTDALEFIFAASDLIDAGWNPESWASEMHGAGHGFVRFCHEYQSTIAPLRAAVQGLVVSGSPLT